MPKAKEKAAGPAPMSCLSGQALIARRWGAELPHTFEYYYDEAAKDLWKKASASSSFPPDDMDLSDAWVVAICNSRLTGEERGARWRNVFQKKGDLRASFVHKGQAAKLHEPQKYDYWVVGVLEVMVSSWYLYGGRSRCYYWYD